VSVGAGQPHTPHGVAVNSRTHRVYATGWGSSYVSVIDGLAGSVLAQVRTDARCCARTSGVAVDEDRNRVFVSNVAYSSVSVIDGRTNTVITEIPVGANPESIAFDPSTNRIYVANGNGPSVSEIDGQALVEIKRIPVPVPQAISVVVDPATHRVWVGNNNDAPLVVIDPAGGTVMQQGPETAATSFGLAVDPTNRRVYVPDYWRGTLAEYDADSMLQLGLVTGLSVPTGVASISDTGTVYVTNRGYGNAGVAVIQADVPSGQGPGGCSSCWPPPPEQTPELSSALLLGMGLLSSGTFWFARTRPKRQTGPGGSRSTLQN
jgi:YVTN family beta-propeller protein